MDVLSLRKASGEVSGDILVNGHPQEPNSFRRITVRKAAYFLNRFHRNANHYIILNVFFIDSGVRGAI